MSVLSEAEVSEYACQILDCDHEHFHREDVEAIVAPYRDALARVEKWFTAVESIQRAYAEIVMDTAEDRALHEQLVAASNAAMTGARAALRSDAHTEQKGAGE